MRRSLLQTLPRVRELPQGVTQTRYTKFLSAPESRLRSMFDAVSERVQKSQEDWKKTHYWKGDLND